MTIEEVFKCMKNEELITFNGKEWHIDKMSKKGVLLYGNGATAGAGYDALTVWESCLDDFPEFTYPNLHGYDEKTIKWWLGKYHHELKKIERIK